MFARGFKSWCEKVAVEQRRVLKLRPFDPLNPLDLAQHLGIEIWNVESIPGIDSECLRTLLEEDPESWSAVTINVGSKKIIISNSAHSDGRRASDLMHEISHILIGHKLGRIDVTEDGLLLLNTYDKQQEEEAMWLTGCLLLPRPAVLLIHRQNMDTKAAERKYGATTSMLRYRLSVTGVTKQSYRP
ncbi:MAG: ImmA/IrrE family metallo-endopeptidase [Pyrinomonadaceae bacterium]